MSKEEIVDYLDEDRPIPGQKYVCLSFVSPEKILDDKKLFDLYRFMKSGKANTELEFEKFQEEYRNYCDDEEESLQTEFDTISDYQTSVRGVKVRGVYDNERAAKIRAQVLQKIDNSFHVFVGQVGFWLPWDPSANKIEEQEYLEENLNKLVKEYNKNQVKKDIFYEEKKSEQKKAALEHSIRQKRLNEEERQKESEKQKEFDGESATVEVESATVEVENVTVTVDENELTDNLDKMDPWMQRKMEGSENQ